MDSSAAHAPGAAAFAFQSWTVIALIAIAILAALVVAGMVWGQKKARERHRVEEAAEARAEETGTALPPASPPPPLASDAALPPEEPQPRVEAPEAEAIREVAPSPAPAPPPPAPLAARELAPEPIPAPVIEPETETKLASEIPAEPEPVAPDDAPAAADAPPAPVAPPEIASALALTTIKGLGPKVAAMLAERGITRVDQLAALSAEEPGALDVQLGAFTGRMGRDRWLDQAKLLAAGDTADYEAEFGKLGSKAITRPAPATPAICRSAGHRDRPLRTATPVRRCFRLLRAGA